MDEKRGLKALETWAKRVTNGYHDVKITDMSSSWRSGLGFCAIIHNYRPDLVDYDSLSKENILHNNSLAFSVAEKQLGVPALLDAEDMEKFQHLDRLSIITYLSQLYNFFENQNKLNKKPPVKRILSEGKSGPPSKISTSELNISTGRKHEVCQTCKHRVYILERLIVSGKLYHRTCFKCCRCGTVLKPGAYVEGEIEGIYECAICPQDETSETDSSLSSVEVAEPTPASDTSVVKDPLPETPKLSLLTSSVDMARNSFLKRSLSQQNGDSHKTHEHSKPSDKEDQSSVKTVLEKEDQPRTSSISVRERISAFECNGGVGSTRPTMKTESDGKVNKGSTSLESSTLSLHSASDNESPTSTHKPYQSVLFRDRSPRPLSRLKLDIAARPLSESSRRFSVETLSLSPISPGLKSSDSAKSFNLNSMPIIKSPTYSLKTLPRQFSLSNVASQEVPSLHLSSKEKINSEENLNSIIHDRWGRIRRRGSLESPKSSNSLNHSFSSYHTISEKDTTVKKDVTHKSSENLENSSKTLSPSSVDPGSIKLNDLSSSKLKTDLLSVGSESISPKSDIQHSFQQQDSFLSSKPAELSQYRISLVNKEKDVNILPTVSSPAQKSESDVKPDSALNIKYNSESTEALGTYNGKVKVILTEHYDSKTVEQNITLSSAAQEQECKKPEKLLNTEVSLPKKADKVDYPDDLNPFGDDDVETVNESLIEPSKASNAYPDDLNPFGNSDEESCDKGEKNDSEYDESMNPFASDDDEEETVSHSESSLSAISRNTPVPAIRTSLLTSPSGVKSPVRQHSTPVDSPTGSLRGTLKKRQAPKPPSVRDIFKNESLDSSDPSSLQTSPSLPQHSLKLPSPKLLKSKPAPPPPPSPSVLPKTKSSGKTSSNDDLANTKQLKDMDNFRLKSSDSVVSSVKASNELHTKGQHQAAENREWKKKKRPAPPVPIPRRREIKKIPLREILSEMTEIELKQEELEKQGRELELQIRDKDKDEEPTVEEEELIMQLFELVNQKNALFRRQAELMYIKRSQKLEEEQADLEYQIRCLMQKPASQKTELDVAREDRLVQRLLDVVDQRNEIIDSIEMDRRREAVEDSSVQEQMDVKNSDLTIPAEIKEKGMQKSKKKHKDKDKKKKKSQEESKGGPEEKSKKNSHHKKKWF